MFSFLRKTALWILLTPLALIFFGATSNQAVLYANHDTFPVSINPIKVKTFTGGYLNTRVKPPRFEGDIQIILPDGTIMLDESHCVMSLSTRLNFLSDIFDFHDRIESVGDLTIDFGYWLWDYALVIWGVVVVVNRLRKREEYGSYD